jgi:REP element-mobilizing transposase RayT
MPKHIKLPGYAYFITTRLAGDLTVFNDEYCCSLLLKDLDFYRRELHYQLYGYVIMFDHFHWIIQPTLKADISVVMNKIKGHASFSINKYLGRTGKLWQKGYHDHIIRNGKDFEEKINYIHKNPIRAGLAAKMADYKFSSYRNYYLGDDSLIKIDIPIYSIA